MHNALRKISVCIATFLFALPVVSMAQTAAEFGVEYERLSYGEHADQIKACAIAKIKSKRRLRRFHAENNPNITLIIRGQSCSCAEYNGVYTCEATTRYMYTK